MFVFTSIMAEIIWTEPALTDLNTIAEYIAISNHLAAKQFANKVVSVIERLAAFPESERISSALDLPNYREVIVNPCRVFYKRNKESVYIMHIMRAEQDLRRFLLHHQ